MNKDTPSISVSPDFEQTIARRALLLGVENLSRILPSLDANQSRILSRGMESVLGASTRVNTPQFDPSQANSPAPRPGI